MKAKRKNRIITILPLVLLTMAFLGAALVFLAERPVSPSSKEQLFTVKKGSSILYITESLKSEGLIRFPPFAYFYARLSGLSLKAGTYSISPAWTTSYIMQYLDSGKQEYNKVTIPEGLSLSKTARHLEDAGVTQAADFIAAASDRAMLDRYSIPGKTAEGYLFPDTYYFQYESEAVDVVRVMLENFFERTSNLPGLPGTPEELYNKVILASIVEREYRVREEAPRIAGVFANRLDIGMGLQSCATIEYIITEIQGRPHPTRLVASDLDIPSDYNTYLWAGLPPGPISNPGIIALTAALRPERSKNLYFRLADPVSGTHQFTTSLDEHVQAGRTLYLKKVAGN